MSFNGFVKKVVRKVFNLEISKVKVSVAPVRKISDEEKINQYIAGGRIPWTTGYIEYKWDLILKSIADAGLLEKFKMHVALPEGFGLKVDDRAVEYPWIVSRMKKAPSRFLDAGSTFNFPTLISQPFFKDKDITILTFYPEEYKFNDKRVSYVYADLREMPLRDNWFDEVVCQSTLEHVGMDNSMYGYENATPEIGKGKEYSYLQVISELIRVLKPGGQLSLTFPFGKYEFHGFFQQFDTEMVDQMKELFNTSGTESTDYFVYSADGWNLSNIETASLCESYNPHTGVGKGTDGAAHSRCICCIQFIKNK